MSSMPQEAGSVPAVFSMIERVIESEMLDSTISPHDALRLSQRLVQYAVQQLPKLEDLTHRISSLEKKPTSPGGCGCEDGKSGITQES